MLSVEDHYETLLSDVYTWLMGGFAQAKQQNIAFFSHRNIKPTGSGIAVDLGAGSGFQSIPLAELGFNVTAIDLSRKLLNELTSNAKTVDIKTIKDDILNFPHHLSEPCELIVCMTDTMTHLKSKSDVLALLQHAFNSLEDNGSLMLSFRDLSNELKDTDRFIPLRSDENIIFTCFLEYEAETVKIHDLVHLKTNGTWTLNKSCYRKLRLSVTWVEAALLNIGFELQESSENGGFQTIVAVKKVTAEHER
ncbi:class I SAM-dependent methyltransferase [Shewanella sp. 3_MG-2023]|uniref:class I SAM-dependent methyltransferase n=1 Tax=Shewanella sp. 3_MG-2023 TaxID=3062635 RepID=UPI0026E28AA1|nr:class I SAM-dependent methyltransferase [Shewanella sp. 3_MG-2023]MDO6777046.1 class I SAM-dependent methyltransferase [Shewanella sp. 3_MG-2023]